MTSAATSRKVARSVATTALATAFLACGLDVVGSALDSNDAGADAADQRSPEEQEGVDAWARDGVGRPVDATSPDGSAPPDGSPPPMFACGATVVTSCELCDGGRSLCSDLGRCVADCQSECGDAQVECIACSPAGGRATSVCQRPGSSAAGCVEPPLVRCPCVAKDDCPGPRQVCSDGGCLGCGEPDSDGLVCKGPPKDKQCKTGGSAGDIYTCK